MLPVTVAPPAPATTPTTPQFGGKQVYASTPTIRQSFSDTVRFGRSSDDDDIPDLQKWLRQTGSTLTEVKSSTDIVVDKVGEMRSQAEDNIDAPTEGEMKSALRQIKRGGEKVSPILTKIQEKIEELEKKLDLLSKIDDEDGGLSGKKEKLGSMGRLLSPITKLATFIVSLLPGGKQVIHNKALEIAKDKD